jgi:hypothetical protein
MLSLLHPVPNRFSLSAKLYHYIAIQDKATGTITYEKHYKGSSRTGDRGEEYWSTYRWQLEVFVDKLRGREPPHWVTNEGSINQMKSIDMVYEKARSVSRGNKNGQELTCYNRRAYLFVPRRVRPSEQRTRDTIGV